MSSKNLVISISGDGQCGKDTAAPILSKLLNIPYSNSTSACIVDHWWDEIKSGLWSAANSNKPGGMQGLIIEPDQYDSRVAFHTDRRNRRMDWVDYIEYYNLSNGDHGIGLYEKTVNDGNFILTGIRRTGQFKRCLEHLIDVSIWMVRDGLPHDESQEYGPELCDYILDNNGNLDDLNNNCLHLACSILTNIRNYEFAGDWIWNNLLKINL